LDDPALLLRGGLPPLPPRLTVTVKVDDSPSKGRPANLSKLRFPLVRRSMAHSSPDVPHPPPLSSPLNLPSLEEELAEALQKQIVLMKCSMQQQKDILAYQCELRRKTTASINPLIPDAVDVVQATLQHLALQ